MVYEKKTYHMKEGNFKPIQNIDKSEENAYLEQDSWIRGILKEIGDNKKLCNKIEECDK